MATKRHARDFTALEQRRKKAARLLAKGDAGRCGTRACREPAKRLCLGQGAGCRQAGVATQADGLCSGTGDRSAQRAVPIAAAGSRGERLWQRCLDASTHWTID